MGESLAWRVKTYLQWTGWLQYIPNMVAAVVVGTLALLLHYLAFARSSQLLTALSIFLLCVLAFDLVTVKLGLHPAEPIPNRRDELDAFDVMVQRRSCRSFQAARDLTAPHLSEIMEAVKTFTEPSQLLGKGKIRFEYVKEPLTVWPVVGAHEFLVALAPKEYDRLAILDVGRSLQKIVLQATRMGLATCWIGPGADHKSVISKLGSRYNEDKDHIICVCAFGYSSWYIPTAIQLIMQTMSKRRMPLGKLFFADPEFQQPLDTKASPYDRFGRCYEACRWGPSSFNAQPVRVLGAQGGRRFDFYGANSSRYYTPVAVGIWLANWETGCQALGLKGHFATLPGEQGTKSLQSDGPVYDMSWMSDEV
ncbi:unnamed protein product [Symbiodinium natans]|uniref:Putative nitroreductase TM1586 domain-containing protein n=1 Tax=Symbiodinium natans TaxID=878477 RepID=A0A812N537_9DINO|nr:unnamed protein product [Symbiodinium natans]